MTGSDIFSRLTPDECHEVFESIHANDKATYRACMQITAQRRRLRPVFLEKKPRHDRHTWMGNVLAMEANDDAATEVLQNWLLGVHRPMIISFLDQCKIPHEDALLEDIPPQPPTDVLESAIDGLFANYPGVAPKIYLQVFQPLAEETWPDLNKMLDADPRLTAHPTGI